MTIWKLGRSLAAVLLIGAGCGSADRPVATANPPATTNAPAPNNSPTKAQPKLQTVKLWVGPEELITEIAIKPIEIETGMMHRPSIAENEAMIFVFGFPSERAFWMRNTIAPLSCAYIDPEGIILETHDMKPLDETAIRSGSDRVQYVLEVKQGWFERHNIKKGAMVRTERGTLAQTFFKR